MWPATRLYWAMPCRRRSIRLLSISALETEQQRTRLEASSTAANILQAMMQMKELGMNKEMMKLFLTKTLQMDEDQAHIYCQLAQSDNADNNAAQTETDES